MRRVILAVVVAVAAATPGVLATSAVVNRIAAEPAVRVEPEAMTLHVEPTTVERTHAVTVVASIGDFPVVRSTTNGIVTSVHVIAGDTLSEGDKVYGADGKTIRAVSGAAPLYRDIGERSSGSDADAVFGLLDLMGYVEDFRSATRYDLRAGIKAYEADHGSVVNGVLEFGDFVWLPTSPFVVMDTALHLGAAVPAPGEPILTAPATIQGITLEGTNGANIDIDEGYTYSISVGGEEEFEVSVDQSGILTDYAPAFVRWIAASIEPGGAGRLAGILLSRSSEPEVSVPVGAVISVGEQSCVWVRSLDSSYEPITVRVESNRLLSARIDGVTRGEVVVNPREIGLLACE